MAGRSAIADPATLDGLEFARALDVIAARAVSRAGSERVRARRPSADPAWVADELTAVRELSDLLRTEDPFKPEPLPALDPVLTTLRLEGAPLDGTELLTAARALEAMRVVRAELLRVAERAPRAGRLAVELPPPALAKRIADTFEPDGTVKPGASKDVDRARARMRDARSELVQSLERTLKSLDARDVPADAAVTVRDGRYVVPVLREARSRVHGIVHGESGSGATLFVEPSVAVDLGNALGAAEAAERRAVQALLRELTDALRPHRDGLIAGVEMCIAADDLYARARYAADVEATVPRLGAADAPYELRGARHPLLLAEGVEAVPFDLVLTPDERCVVVSGPNTGGKTVLLKAIGLVSALAQSGVVPPVGPETVIPVFARIVADIGDRQSIAASLSTFSAHLVELRSALELADRETLVLLDEVGSGTDPVEGAALASASLVALAERGARTVASTHLGDLKALAAETAGVVNASLAFNAETLEPTYRLVQGVPGRSYGLVIARRLGIPEEIVSRAEQRTPERERALDAVLADAERRTRELDERETTVGAAEARLASERETVSARLADLETRARELAERERTLEREGREQARRFLLEARKRVEEALGLARAAVTEATAKEARRLVEDGISSEAEKIKAVEAEFEKKGWTVIGAPRTAHGAGRTDASATAAPDRLRPPVAAPSEIDLRGMTADEARVAVTQAIDAAVLADLPVIRIIHGKGTGVLRNAVGALLDQDARIASHRLAPPPEGGSGVTIAELVP